MNPDAEMAEREVKDAVSHQALSLKEKIQRFYTNLPTSELWPIHDIKGILIVGVTNLCMRFPNAFCG